MQLLFQPQASISTRKFLLWFLLFSCLAILITWPLLLNIDEVIYGSGDLLLVFNVSSTVFIPFWFQNIVALCVIIMSCFLYTGLLRRILLHDWLAVVGAFFLQLIFTNYWRDASAIEFFSVFLIFPAFTWMWLYALERQAKWWIVPALTLAYFVGLFSLDLWVTLYVVAITMFFLYFVAHKNTAQALSKQCISYAGVGALLSAIFTMIGYAFREEPAISNTRHLRLLYEGSVSFFEPITPAHYLFGEPVAYVGIIFAALFYMAVRLHTAREHRVWLWLAAIFGTFSLGPALTVFGRVDPIVPLPYTFISQYLPFSTFLSAPGTFYLPAVFCVVVSVLLLWRQFMNEKRVGWNIVMPIVLVFAVFEVPFLPANSQAFTFIQTYEMVEQLPLSEQEFAVDLREQKYDDDLSQKVKEYNDARYAALPVKPSEDIQYSTVLHKIAGAKTTTDIFPELTKEAYSFRAYEEGMRYLLFSPYDRNASRLIRDAEDTLDIEFYAQNDEIIIYTVNQAQDTGEQYVSLNEHWSQPRQTKKAKTVYRFARRGAQLELRNVQDMPTAVYIEFDTQEKQPIQIHINGELVYSETIEVGDHTALLPVLDLGDQAVTINFDLKEQVKIFSMQFQ